mmetsp:Transcript_16799/g.31831  ORF Transcript_16799/g.31831 Transcript_16799/m.31831 type:complete len:1230 (+) Transcript_16799:81-3770(+)
MIDKSDSKPTCCPCSSFDTPSLVISALLSFEKTQRLIEWIRGDYYQIEGVVNFEKISSSAESERTCHRLEKNSSRCKRRVSAAYCILNAIRDACRIFLEKEQYLASDGPPHEMPPVPVHNVSQVEFQSYDEAFPSLSSTASQNTEPNVLKPKQKKNDFIANIARLTNVDDSRLCVNSQAKREVKVKVKRRITPAKIQTNEEPKAWGNISSLSNSESGQSEIFRNVTVSSSESKISTRPKIWTDKVTSGSVGAFANASMQQYTGAATKTSLESQNIAKIKEIVEKTAPVSLLRYSEEREMLMNNTVFVYCEIIQIQLAPSVAVELQLMLRLLSVSEKNTPTNRATSEKCQSLTSLFVDHDSCRQFAVLVLTRLKFLILNIDQEILSKLLGIRVFVELMPELAREIKQNVEFHRNSLISKGEYRPQDGRYSGMVSGTNTILTLPFQQERDSRHNYQSRELASIYNNREKCRDTFLSQLRAFQQMKVTLMNPEQIQRSFDRIKVSLLRMKSELLPSNTSWFVEFFTEMLLQIGLVPMQELDDDILKNVADKNRLQKLHNRFTSKVAQKNRSIKLLVLTDSAPKSNSSPDHLFMGHQEFFFIFLNTVDSHSLNHHLKRRLVNLILSKSSSNELKDVELRINELKMLAKFLGMLVFSPNWDIDEISITDTANFSLITPTIPVNSIIEEAYNNGKLVLVLPWILSYLWMMSWDRASMKLRYYKYTFGILRYIHRSIMNVVSEECSHLAKNLFIIGLQLDLFFSDVVGLSEIESQEEWKRPCPAYNRNKNTLDASALTLSKQYLFSASVHFDDLHKLVIDIESNGRLMSAPGASKKLRPQPLSNLPKDLLPSNTSERFDTLDPFDFEKLQDFMIRSPLANGLKSQSKLADKFFHQHKQINQICDFVISFCIEHVVSKSWLEKNILPVVEQIVVGFAEKTNIKHPVDLDWYLTHLQMIEREVWIVFSYRSQTILKNYVLRAMDALTPIYVDHRVKDIAITLAINHALEKGNVQTASVIRFKAKRVIDKLLDDDNMTLKTPTPKLLSTCDLAAGANLLHDIHKLIEKLEASYNFLNTLSKNAFCTNDFSDEIHHICNEMKSLDDIFYEHDASLRVLVTTLVQALAKMIQLWVNDENVRSNTDGKFFKEIVDLIYVLPSRGLISNDSFLLGSLVANPSVLSSILQLDIDASWVRENIIRNELMNKIELVQGFTVVLESHLISQETASMLISFLNDMRVI